MKKIIIMISLVLILSWCNFWKQDVKKENNTNNNPIIEKNNNSQKDKNIELENKEINENEISPIKENIEEKINTKNNEISTNEEESINEALEEFNHIINEIKNDVK